MARIDRSRLAAERLSHLGGLAEIALERGAPKTANFAVTAIRSISGKLSGRGEVEVVELHRRVDTDAEGNFLLRAMPAGTFTLVGRTAHGAKTGKVELSREPVKVVVGDRLWL